MLDEACLDQLFRTARTHNRWQDRPVTDDELRTVFDLLKLLGMGGRWGVEGNFLRYFDELRQPFEEVDWPFVLENKPAVDWLANAPISGEDKAKIFSGNAKRLLKL